MKIKTLGLAVVLCFAIFHVEPGYSQFNLLRRHELQCKHILPITTAYFNRHITYEKESKNLEKRTVDQFIKRLDGSKMYLLSADVKKIKKMMNNIFKKVKARNCKGILEAHKIFEKRVAERVKFAKEYLGPKFKFNKKTQLVLDYKSRKYAKNQKAANRFHKKYIQFQVANYLSTDMKLKEAKEHVARNYERVLRRFTKEFKTQDLWSSYLDSFAHSLDPHSSYLSREELEDFEIQMRLSLDGIGATLSFKDGFTVVEQLIPGGAAFRSGQLKPKDKIVAVKQEDKKDFVNVIEMKLRDVVRLIRGPKGTKVTLRILRKKGKQKSFEVTLVRDKIKLEDEAARITYIEREVKGAKKKIGLLNLPSFYADQRRNGRSAAKDMKRLLQEANKQKVDAVVLDLSTNGGGSLDDAVKIAGLFFKTGNVVKQSQHGTGSREIELADEDPKVDWAGPLVVLTSRISASASEIVAGTLKDYKRAVVVGGDHTFGKGSVQSVESLGKHLGAFKTTVGMFFTPGGFSTQHRGVPSDIVLPSGYSTEDIGERTLDYSLPPKKIKSFLSKSAYVSSGEGRWSQVSRRLIKKLAQKSKNRVKKNKKFQEILKDLAKSKKKNKAIKVSELMDDKAEAETKKNEADADGDGVLSRAEKQKKYLERPDVLEALNIAVDFLAETSPKVTVGAKSLGKKSSAEN